ncbi:MAG: helix-turn-helix domain-containing protein [Rhodoplanes sp.]
MNDLLRMIRPAVFVGSSRKDLRAFPAKVRQEIGQSLFTAQLGDHPGNAKPLKGSAAPARGGNHPPGNREGSEIMSKKSLPAHDIGSGNIFADLGLPNAEERQLKAALVVQLSRLIQERKLSQTATAKLLGVKQPDLSNILSGHYRGYSVARLMRMLTAFNQDVEITTRPHRKTGAAGRIIFSPHAG